MLTGWCAGIWGDWRPGEHNCPAEGAASGERASETEADQGKTLPRCHLHRTHTQDCPFKAIFKGNNHEYIKLRKLAVQYIPILYMFPVYTWATYLRWFHEERYILYVTFTFQDQETQAQKELADFQFNSEKKVKGQHIHTHTWTRTYRLSFLSDAYFCCL